MLEGVGVGRAGGSTLVGCGGPAERSLVEVEEGLFALPRQFQDAPVGRVVHVVLGAEDPLGKRGEHGVVPQLPLHVEVECAAECGGSEARVEERVVAEKLLEVLCPLRSGEVSHDDIEVGDILDFDLVVDLLVEPTRMKCRIPDLARTPFAEANAVGIAGEERDGDIPLDPVVQEGGLHLLVRTNRERADFDVAHLREPFLLETFEFFVVVVFMLLDGGLSGGVEDRSDSVRRTRHTR